jgi:hypothetical protein
MWGAGYSLFGWRPHTSGSDASDPVPNANGEYGGNSARNRGTARATASGRTFPFRGEGGKVRDRRN